MKVEISGIGFNEQEIQITWADLDKVGDHGGTVFLTTITEAAQDDDQQVRYWSAELRQAVDELLGAWLILTKRPQ